MDFNCIIHFVIIYKCTCLKTSGGNNILQIVSIFIQFIRSLRERTNMGNVSRGSNNMRMTTSTCDPRYWSPLDDATIRSRDSDTTLWNDRRFSDFHRPNRPRFPSIRIGISLYGPPVIFMMMIVMMMMMTGNRDDNKTEVCAREELFRAEI